ncbi:MAG TPA: hypothetical protein PL064_07250 [Thermogutta sp.]|nr:hypothetical protein [Thermogutta sp.]
MLVADNISRVQPQETSVSTIFTIREVELTTLKSPETSVCFAKFTLPASTTAGLA